MPDTTSEQALTGDMTLSDWRAMGEEINMVNYYVRAVYDRVTRELLVSSFLFEGRWHPYFTERMLVNRMDVLDEVFRTQLAKDGFRDGWRTDNVATAMHPEVKNAIRVLAAAVMRYMVLHQSETRMMRAPLANKSRARAATQQSVPARSPGP